MPRIVTHSRPLTLFGREPFTGFGPSRFIPSDHCPGCHRVKGAKPATLCRAIRSHAPKRPGVYAMLDQCGRVIYVGKAKRLRVRLLSYFRGRGGDPKAARILRRTRFIVWEHATDEFAALLRELELIQRFRPRFNVIGQPGRRRYVYLTVTQTPATIVLSASPKGDEGATFGPFVSRGRVQSVVRRLLDRYRLRDCPSTVRMVYAGDASLFETAPPSPQCLRHDLNLCLGPCAARCTARKYESNVRQLKAFLSGKDRSLLDEVKAEMVTASEALQFERAALTRDKLADFTWLDERLAQLQKARERATHLYPVVGHDGRTTWYVIDRGQVVSATLADGAVPPGHLMTVPKTPLSSIDRSVDSVLLVAAWFRKNGGERARLVAVKSSDKPKWKKTG
jgi:excinuclease ABC subunit C